jgi:multidrug efflux pump subunit AcrA (membrane-fusion protein)
MSENPNVQAVRERVLQLARQIDKLSDPRTPEETFFPQFLEILVQTMAAQAGAVWMQDGQNQLKLAWELNLGSTGFFETPNAPEDNYKLLLKTLDNGQTTLIGSTFDGNATTPTGHMLLLSPLLKGKKVAGVVQIFQRAGTPEQAQHGYLQFMEQACGRASRYLVARDQPLPDEAPTPEYWKQFENFVLQMQRSLRVDEVAGTAANDGRLLLQCDRVSVALHRGNRCHIQSISGQESVNRRANLVTTMGRLTDSVIATSEPLLFAGKAENLPPQIEKPLAEYIQEAGSRMLMIIPLLPPDPPIRADEKEVKEGRRKVERKKPFGALIVEQVTDSRPKPGLVERSNMVAEHVAAALHNARTHQTLFLLPLWRFLGDVYERLYRRTLLKIAAFVLVLTGVIVGLFLIPWTYRVEGKGKLLPVTRAEVFSPWEGEVIEILVKASDRVKKGDIVLKLRNEELRAKLLEAENKLATGVQSLASLKARLEQAERGGSPETVIQLRGEQEQTTIQIAGAKEQVTVLREQVEQLIIRAPIDGTVSTFELEKLLLNRPVQRGEVLLEVMDETQRWHLELEVQEQRMGHFLRGVQVRKTNELPVEFMLATNVEDRYYGKVEMISTRAALTEAEGSVVEVHASINEDEIPKLRPRMRIGAEVRAKISCSDRSLGYVLFGDVIEFVHKYLLFW